MLRTRTEITRAISNSFPTQTRQSYYYEKRFPILYISEYYIYRIIYNIYVLIAGQPPGGSRWADLLLPRRAARLDRWSVLLIANVDDAPRDASSAASGGERRRAAASGGERWRGDHRYLHQNQNRGTDVHFCNCRRTLRCVNWILIKYYI